MTSKNEEINEEVVIEATETVEPTEEVKDETQEKFNLFGQNLAVFELETGKLTSASLKKLLKITAGYPLAVNADDINKNVMGLNEKELSIAKVGCALKEQVINLFLEQQYTDLTSKEKGNE